MEFGQAFAGFDAILLDVLGDSAFLDVLGTGVALVPCKGEFVDPHDQPRIGTLRTDIIEPQFTVDQSVDLSGVVKGTSLLRVNGSVYKIINVIPDGSGLTVLVLKPQ